MGLASQKEATRRLRCRVVIPARLIGVKLEWLAGWLAGENGQPVRSIDKGNKNCLVCHLQKCILRVHMPCSVGVDGARHLWESCHVVM